MWKEIIRSYVELATRNDQELWNIVVILRELLIFCWVKHYSRQSGTADGTSLVVILRYIVLVLHRIYIYTGEEFYITKREILIVNNWSPEHLRKQGCVIIQKDQVRINLSWTLFVHNIYVINKAKESRGIIPDFGVSTIILNPVVKVELLTFARPC